MVEINTWVFVGFVNATFIVGCYLGYRIGYIFGADKERERIDNTDFE